MNKDKNFDQLAGKFRNNIYGTSKGKVRMAVLWRDLTEYLARGPLKILDIGGGQGQVGLKLAALGHDVTINDISLDMLSIAEQSAKEKGLSCRFIHSPLQELDTHTEIEAFDLVLCHAVLEWVEAQRDAVAQICRFIKPGGQLSLMFYNYDAKLLGNLIYGNFDYIDDGMQAKKTVKLNPQHPARPQRVADWLEESRVVVEHKTGVRCFHDYMFDRQMWDTKVPEIIEKELAYAREEPFVSIGKYLHYMCKKSR